MCKLHVDTYARVLQPEAYLRLVAKRLREAAPLIVARRMQITTGLMAFVLQPHRL